MSKVFAGKDMDYNTIVVRDDCDAGSQNQTVNDTLMDLIFPRMSRLRMAD